jgi:hypothetical protein
MMVYAGDPTLVPECDLVLLTQGNLATDYVEVLGLIPYVAFIRRIALASPIADSSIPNMRIMPLRADAWPAALAQDLHATPLEAVRNVEPWEFEDTVGRAINSRA